MQLLRAKRDQLLAAAEEGIGFVVSLFFHQLPTLAPLASDVYESGLTSHDARGTITIVSEAGGITHQEPFRVFEERLESIGIFAPVGPREDTAERHDGFRRVVFEEVVNEVHAVAHPLVGNSTGELPVEPELEVKAGIERAIRLGQEPFLPVGILFTDLVHLLPASPARAVIVPDDLHFADVSQRSTGNRLFGRYLVRLAAVLRADLHDQITRPHSVTGGLGLLQHVRHWLFAICVFASLSDKLEQRRVLEVRSGNNNRVNILLGEQVLEVCERPRFPLIDLPGCLSGSIAIYFP